MKPPPVFYCSQWMNEGSKLTLDASTCENIIHPIALTVITSLLFGFCNFETGTIKAERNEN